MFADLVFEHNCVLLLRECGWLCYLLCYSWIYFKICLTDNSDVMLHIVFLNNYILFYREALKRAKLLLSMKHGLARLDNVWGVGGGQRPVMYLINKVVTTF